MPHAFRHMPADWLLALAAVRRALVPAADPGRSCLESLRLAPLRVTPIGTAMLSYTEHGKFQALVQGFAQAHTPTLWPGNATKNDRQGSPVPADPPRIFCDVPHCEWIMGCAQAQYPRAQSAVQGARILSAGSRLNRFSRCGKSAAMDTPLSPPRDIALRIAR